MSRVSERRLRLWPDPVTRAEAAKLYEGGMELRAVLERYPNEVVTVDGGKNPRRNKAGGYGRVAGCTV